MVKLKKAQKSTKGSALFMVICVMAILMVVAVTAMAMVSIAYTRSLQNYTASQSYITAVNTLDMITETTHYTGEDDYPAYGQTSETDISKIAKPVRELLFRCVQATIDGDPIGGQTEVGKIEITDGPLSGEGLIEFVEFTDDNGDTGNILYEVLPPPANPADGNAEVVPGKPECGYGDFVFYDDRCYTHAKIKITVKVKSGTGDTAQIRTVSKVVDPVMSWEESGLEYNTVFDDALKAIGNYSGGAGAAIYGGISTKGNSSVNLANLAAITRSLFINDDVTTGNSGHSGYIEIGADRQIVINGDFNVPNMFKLKSVFNPGTDSGAKPFICCNSISWTNSDIPTGDIDVLTREGGTYGRDNNEIKGNVLSGGDLTLVGNNLKISGKIFVDGNVNIQNGLSNGGGTIYYTGSISGNTGGVNCVPITAANADDYKFDIESIGDGNIMEDEDSPYKGFEVIHLPDDSITYYVMTEDTVFDEVIDEDGNVIPANDPFAGAVAPPFNVFDDEGNAIPEEEILRIDASTTGSITLDPDVHVIVLEFIPGTDITLKDLEIIVPSGVGEKDEYGFPRVNIVQPVGDVTLENVKIISEEMDDLLGSTFDDDDLKALGASEDYTRIYWDMPAGSTMTLSSTGGGNLLNAYIYGPEADFFSNNQNAGRHIDYDRLPSGYNAWLLGSVIANNVDMGNQLAIIYAPPIPSGDDDGDDDDDDDPEPTSTAETAVNVRYNLSNGNYYFTNR